VWPEPIERIAAFLRAAGLEGRLEELPPGAEAPPGATFRAEGFDVGGRRLVVLIPADGTIDRTKLATLVGSADLRSRPSDPFPFHGTRVFLDSSAFLARTVWLEAGSRRHMIGAAPRQLAQAIRSETADVLVDPGAGDVPIRGRG
jgi:prolyl-tRNA editing enzyme YbaK/EbsC (Cys-tRNA(Pro) deacylase)